MDGKTVVLTGASLGIGKVTALALARLGARLVLICRDPGRGSVVVDAIRSGGGSAELIQADLSVMDQVRRAGSEVLGLCPRIDVLINNAGAVNQRRSLTSDGLERTFATNHLAYFLLTRLLLERLTESAPARVINVASDAHRAAPFISFDDLNAERAYGAWRRYAESKLANILFTRELARRLEGSGVIANSMHPGGVATGFGLNSTGPVHYLGRAAQLFMLTPEQGADTVIYLASSPEPAAANGKYFYKRREKTPRPQAEDDAAAERLWEVSERLIALSGQAKETRSPMTLS